MSPLPPLGIFGFTGAAPGDFVALETQIVGSGGAASITFGSGGTIPQGYKHLEIHMIGRMTGGANNCWIKFNGDTGSNYSFHQLYGDGGGGALGAGGNGLTTPSNCPNFNVPAAAANANVFGAGIMAIWDYSSTLKNKTIRTFTGHDNNGDGYIIQRSSYWNSTNAITSIVLTPDLGVNFAQYSHFALYGIKG